MSLQIALDQVQSGGLALLDRLELRVGQADRATGLLHRLLVRGESPYCCRSVAREAQCAGGGNHSAARDPTDMCCQTGLFLAAGNIIMASTYSSAAERRTRLKPASRAIRLA